MNAPAPVTLKLCMPVWKMAALFFLVAFVATGDSAERNDPATGPILAPGTISATLPSGETQTYRLSLSANQHGVLELAKADGQLKGSLCPPEGRPCMNLVNRRYGTIGLSFSSVTAGTYELKLTSLERSSAIVCQLQLSDLVVTTPRHRLAESAEHAIAEAEALRQPLLVTSRLAAVAKYGDATRLWVAAGESERAIDSLCNMGDVYFLLSEYRSALTQYKEALGLAQRSGDEIGLLASLNGIGYTNVYLGDNAAARVYAKQMLDIVQRVDASKRSPGYRRAEAQALNTLGEVDYSLGELRKSIEEFAQALSIYTEIGERGGQALALLNMGYSHNDLGNTPQATTDFQSALTQFESIGDQRGSALAQTALGGLRSLFGDDLIAMGLHQRAADYFRAIGNKQGEAAALNGVARAYQNLNEYDDAYERYFRALRLYQEIENRDFTAINMFLVGRILFLKGDPEAAFPYYSDSLKLTRVVGDQVTEAHALKGLGTVYLARGKSEAALTQFEAAQEIYRKLGNRRSEAYVLNDIGHIQAARHDLSTALANFQQALVQMRNTADRHGEALTLYNTAKAERDRGNLDTALALIQDAIEIGESLRSKVSNAQLRTSFFASIHDQYELLIDVLMLLHAREPTRGYAAMALLASERARARSLLDSLLKEKIESQNPAAVDLLAQEQELLNSLDKKIESQTRLLSGKHTEEEAQALSREIHDLTLNYHKVRANWRAKNPRQALLIQPDQVKAEDLQSLLKGDDALILEFALGDERSYLWLVSQSEITGYQLPAREIIETQAHHVYESMTLRQLLAEQGKKPQSAQLAAADRECLLRASELSATLLGPVANRLESKRLVIIGDGLLRFIPFEALPVTPADREAAGADPADRELLIDHHEIVSEPSALSLAALRSEKESTEGSGTIAIFADPVFERDDPRVKLVTAENASPPPALDNVYLASTMRDFSTDSEQGPARLASTLIEAKDIMEFVPAGKGVMATGFDATRQRLVNDGMGDYRILHLATHGILNREHPDLSGIILSLVDEHGQNIDGFLRLHDIYNLRVSSDLVVLSACRTALGKDVRGEGVVGLSSGFLYAGAKGVVASLWKVDDNTTAEFMRYFYAALLKDHQPPATALRSAKLEMRKQARWQAPFYWAGFVIQGEYKNVLERPQRARGIQLVIVATIAILVIGLYASRRYWRAVYSRP